MNTKNFPMWEQVVLIVVAIMSFIVGILSSGLIDGIMALAINTLIVFGLLKLGNYIFRKK